MWRALFVAVGISLCVLGTECLVVEKAVLAKPPSELQPTGALMGSPRPLPSSNAIEPPEWAPWSLLSAGAVVLLYSFTIPRRVTG